MIRFVCNLCSNVIRRPMDHFLCVGSKDNSYLKIIEYNPDKKITKEIIVPESIKIS